jgi:hypothetical protein
MTTTSAAPALSLTIGVGDLTSASQLRKLLVGDAKPAFTFGTQIAPYWAAPVQSVPNGTTVAISVNGSGNWKTSGAGIGFSLAASAKSQLKVVRSGAVITYAPDLQSKATARLPEGPYNGSAYIVFSLDFLISGNVNASGNISGVGIGGNVKGSTDTSVLFSHLVPDSMKLCDAIKEAFEKFVLAFEPSCAMDMNAGDIAEVNFNGSLACGLDVSYGFANVSFSAPGVASVLDSVTKGAEQFTLPTGKVVIGAEATVNYTHADDFTAIVQKVDASKAFLYVMRAHKNDLSEGLSVAAKVTITNSPSVTVDPKKLEQAINSITGTGGEQAAALASDLQQGLNAKLSSWIDTAVDKGASLAMQWDQNNTVSMLFKYGVDLRDVGQLSSTWSQLCRGDLKGAVSRGGLIPEAGSGVSNELSDSFTVSLQFFNLFSASSTSTYFEKSYVVVTQAGNLRYMLDVGKESETDVNKAKRICVIHFVATVDQTTAKAVSEADVDLVLEVKATDDKKEAGRIGDLVGLIPPNQQVNQAQKSMQQFVASNPSGTLDLICVLKPSAYGRLSCSEYIGNKPPVNQQQDSENWAAFHDAAVSLMQLGFVKNLNYADWQEFNVLCVHAGYSGGTADRRADCNTSNVPSGHWGASAPTQLISYFLMNSAHFMNLCDDLHELAGLTSVPSNSSTDVTAYNDVLSSLVKLIVGEDVKNDYSKATIGALLRLSNPQNVTSKNVSDKISFACTLTLT